MELLSYLNATSTHTARGAARGDYPVYLQLVSTETNSARWSVNVQNHQMLTELDRIMHSLERGIDYLAGMSGQYSRRTSRRRTDRRSRSTSPCARVSA